MKSNDEIMRLLNEAYVFIAMHHKAHAPWRIELENWQARVELKTGWEAVNEIKKFRTNGDLS